MKLDSIEKMPINLLSVRENIMVHAHLCSKYGVDSFISRHHLDCLEKAFLDECEMSPNELNIARDHYREQSDERLEDEEAYHEGYDDGWSDGYDEAESEFGKE